MLRINKEIRYIDVFLTQENQGRYKYEKHQKNNKFTNFMYNNILDITSNNSGNVI